MDPWVLLDVLVNLECLEITESKVHLVPPDYLVSRELVVREDRLEIAAHLEPRVCLDQKDKRDLLVLMVHLDLKDLLDLMDHLETEVHLVFLDLLDLLVLEAQWELKENAENLDPLVKKDHLDPLVYKDHLDQWVSEEKEEKKVPLVAKVLLVLVEGLVTRDHLDQLE